MRKILTISTFASLITALALLTSGCSGDKSSNKKKEDNNSEESTESTESAAANDDEGAGPVAVGPIMRHRTAEGKPQKNLTYLVSQGKLQIQGVRGERKSIYEIFNKLRTEEINRVTGLIRKIRNFRFDERPERLMAAPAKIYVLVDALFLLSDAAREDGEGALLRHEQMISEVNSGTKKHKETAIDAKWAEGNSQVKLSNFSAILARNLIDEAIHYAQYGSLEMQDQMRDSFAGLKGRGPEDDLVQDRLHILLWMVRTEGVDRPE